ncbi:MAG: hypothetical protein AB7S26_11765 [Sandaracinaceae bacterium]
MSAMSELNPRVRGLIAIGGGLVLVALNLIVAEMLDQWYPVLFPIAGAAFAVGGFGVVTGIALVPGQTSAPIRVLLGVIGLVGVAAGCYANVLFAGSVF